MRHLVVDYGFERSFDSALKSARSELDKRSNDYKGIANKAYSVPLDSGNARDCGNHANRKSNQIQDKISKLNSFGKRVDSFVENVKATDKRVASRIKSDTKAFQKRTGIGRRSITMLASTSLTGALSSIKDWIVDQAKYTYEYWKEFYEKNKYKIHIVMDIVGLVAACFALSGGGILGVYFLSEAYFELYYDLKAYHYYRRGYNVTAEEMSKKGGKEAWMAFGRYIDKKTGNDVWEETLGEYHEVIDKIAIIYSFYKIGAQLLKDLKIDKLRVFSRRNIDWGKHINKETIGKAFRNLLGFKKIQEKNVVKTQYSVLGTIFGDSGPFLSSESARAIEQLKMLIHGGKKVVKIVKKVYKYTRPVIYGF